MPNTALLAPNTHKDFKVRAGCREFSSVKSAMERLGIDGISESDLKKALLQEDEVLVRRNDGEQTYISRKPQVWGGEFRPHCAAINDKVHNTYAEALKAVGVETPQQVEQINFMFKNAGRARFNGYGIERAGSTFIVFKYR